MAKYVFETEENNEGKVKMLVASNFSFSHNVFKSFFFFSQGCKRSGLCGKGLKGVSMATTVV